MWKICDKNIRASGLYEDFLAQLLQENRMVHFCKGRQSRDLVKSFFMQPSYRTLAINESYKLCATGHERYTPGATGQQESEVTDSQFKTGLLPNLRYFTQTGSRVRRGWGALIGNKFIASYNLTLHN